MSEEDVGGCQRRQTRGTQRPPGADGLPVFVLISEYLDLSAAKYDRRSDVQVQLVEELIPVTSVVSTLVHNSFVFERPQYTERALVDVPKFLIFGSGCAIRHGLLQSVRRWMSRTIQLGPGDMGRWKAVSSGRSPAGRGGSTVCLEGEEGGLGDLARRCGRTCVAGRSIRPCQPWSYRVLNSGVLRSSLLPEPVMMKLSGKEQMALIHVLESTVMDATGWTADCIADDRTSTRARWSRNVTIRMTCRYWCSPTGRWSMRSKVARGSRESV